MHPPLSAEEPAESATPISTTTTNKLFIVMLGLSLLNSIVGQITQARRDADAKAFHEDQRDEWRKAEVRDREFRAAREQGR